ncbi:MAG: efflux RND transporter permease subunit [Deltaproteobacteria bacterium]|nr:efflux RND transporter permease subunit [Deltaproteobacteria bacterium]
MIAKASVNRPVLTTVIFFIIIIIGLVSLQRLSIDFMPSVEYPTVTVSASYGNVGPQEIEELITRPLEESLAAVQGVEEISSTSSEGSSRVSVSFEWGTDLDVATNDVRERIDRITRALPDDVDRPNIMKFDVNSMPIIYLGASSSMSILDLRELIEDQVQYRLERVNGVASTDIRGGLNREIHINLKASKLKALGLSPQTVITALNNENMNVPAGTYETGSSDILIRTQGEFSTLNDISETVVAIKDGIPIRVGDIADVEDSWEEITNISRINGEEGLNLMIYKQSGANTVQVAEGVKAEIEQINLDLPQIKMFTIMDQSKYIEQSINDVGLSAILGGVLAVLILFVMLRNISSTFIIATAIPVSIIATFALLYFGDFTLNVITFGGLALGIGMLVDDSIVVLENIYRHRESGLNPIDSTITGTSEVVAAVVASTLTTLVVFIPVVFIQGMSGIIFKQMAAVVCFSLLCSLLVALSLVPMLASRFLHYTPSKHYSGENLLHRFYSFSEEKFKRLEEGYSSLLKWALGHRKTVIFLTLGLFLISLFLVRFIGVELMPTSDEGQVSVSLEMAVGTTLEPMDKITLQAEEIIRSQVPEMTSMLSNIGGGGWRSSGSNSSNINIVLVPKDQRKRSSEEVANDLRRSLSNLPGVTVTARQSTNFMLRMSYSNTDSISVEVRGYDLETAKELAIKVEELVKAVPGITDTNISRDEGSPEQILRIDRKKAADMGLTVSLIGRALETAVGGSTASYLRESGKEYKILVRLSEEDRTDLSDLLDLAVVNNQGKPVVLRNVIVSESQEGPTQIERKDQERIISIRANFTGRDMGSVISDIRNNLRTLPIPKEFSIQFGSDYEEQQESFRQLMMGSIMAIVLIYLVLAGQYESFKDPFIILFSIPMALIGVTIVMILFNTIFSMYAFIGAIIMAGIVVKNAILLVDYTNQLIHIHGIEFFKAIRLAGARRLRPIIMTTLTTTLGMLPLSLGWGEGGETQVPMARVVIGGLLSSTLITLVLIPVVYSLFNWRLKSKNTTVTQ